jgi:integrase
LGARKKTTGVFAGYPTHEEAKLRAAIERGNPDHVPAFDLSVHTGMRSGEQFSLQWSQVDWERRIVILPRTKNGNSRHVPLNAVALRQIKKRHDEIQPDSPWVHLNGDKAKLRGHRDWFEPALINSGLVEYSWHCNRHTFASRLVMAGVDLRTVGELLGHRTPSMTWRYSHLAPAHQQRDVDLLVATEKPGKRRAQVPPRK